MSRSSSTASERPRRPVRTLVKWLLFALVMWFVVRRGFALWDQGRQEELAAIPIRLSWLLAAGSAYLIGWLPAVWFWKRMIVNLGGQPAWRDTLRAYFCGHLGKYVPGKAVVLVVRGSLMKDRGCRAGVAVLTAGLETLFTMAVGGALAIALSPFVLPSPLWSNLPGGVQWLEDYPYLVPVGMAIGCALALPPVVRLISRVSAKMLTAMDKRRGLSSEETELSSGQNSVVISRRLLLKACLPLLGVWCLHGLSLGLTLHAFSDHPWDFSAWPIWTTAVSAATVVGFLAVFAPGGIGVREGILIEVLRLQPGLHPQQIILAALLLRMVWFVTELTAAGSLYYGVKPTDKKADH